MGGVSSLLFGMLGVGAAAVFSGVLGLAVAHFEQIGALTRASVLSVQYFAKLTRSVHWGLLAVGFGSLVLGLAAFYERKLERLLVPLSRWD